MRFKKIQCEETYLTYSGFLSGSFGVCHLRVLSCENHVLFLFSELHKHPGPSVGTAATKLRAPALKWVRSTSPLSINGKKLVFCLHNNDYIAYGGDRHGCQLFELIYGDSGVDFLSISVSELSARTHIPARMLLPGTDLLLRPSNPISAA